MVANPGLQAYRYDPYGKRMTKEYYDTDTMMATRRCVRAGTAACLLH